MLITDTSDGKPSRGLRVLIGRLVGRRQRSQDKLHFKHRSTNTDCIFCQPHNPSLNRTMCENELFYARYDNFPANEGHVEIVPKRHVESFFELDDREILSAYALMRKARKIIDEQHFPEAYTIGVNDGKAAGRTIDHLHIHLIPRHQGDVKDPRGGIRKAAPNCDPDAWN